MKKKLISQLDVKKSINKMRKWEKKHPILTTIREGYYHIIRFIEDVPLNVKSFIQRAKRGWSDRDTWGFSYYLAKTISKGVYHLKKYAHCHPNDLTEGQWMDVLNKITATFDKASRISDGNLYLIKDKKEKERWQKVLDDINKEYETNDRCMTSKEIREYNQGWTLFREYFFSLWD